MDTQSLSGSIMDAFSSIFVSRRWEFTWGFKEGFAEKIALWFSENEGAVKGRFEFFRKFIRLDSLTRPLSSIFVSRRWQMGVQTKLCNLNNSSLSISQIISGVESKIIQNL